MDRWTRQVPLESTGRSPLESARLPRQMCRATVALGTVAGESVGQPLPLATVACGIVSGNGCLGSGCFGCCFG